MLSIFIMYSSDRKDQLELTLSFLKQMELYEHCQKTLVVDGKSNIVPDDFEVIQVPRIKNKEFCWGNMWEAGVATARFDKVLYLDSDRLLPKSYLKQVLDHLDEDSFVFTSRHFMMTKNDIENNDLVDLLETPIEEAIFCDPKYAGCLKFEPRFKEPFPGPGKNVMSGNTAFYKETYYELGGVDPWYCGHGAYADTDFHMTAGKAGCKFVDLELPEIHCHHLKYEQDNPLTIDELHLLSLDNFIYYVHKWGLPTILADNIAYECRLLDDPIDYVIQKIKAYANITD